MEKFLKSVKFRALVLVFISIGALQFSSPSWGFEVDVANAPQNNLSLILDSIQGAKKSIHFNCYTFTSATIAKALISQIEAGIQVTVLQEGEPVNGISPEGLAVQSKLVKAMQASGGNNHFYLMTSKATGKRRFVFDHAKYLVIDEVALQIGSENFSATGHPAPGTIGNRGWEVRIHDPVLANSFLTMFKDDSNLAKGDIIDLTKRQVASLEFPMENELASEITPFETLEAKTVTKITSPENSLSGLTRLIHGAKSTIDIEQMSFSSTWENNSSPLADAVIAAARRGVQVRVLLNDESVFKKLYGDQFEKNQSVEPVNPSTPKKPSIPKNQKTVNLFNQIAKAEGLNMSAKIADVEAMGVGYIHNKGMLIDDDQTLISSINWGQNSVINNREAAVLISSPDVHDYYQALFEKDWNASARNIGLHHQPAGQTATQLQQARQ